MEKVLRCYRTKACAQFLKKHGITITARTLQKYRCEGSGPKYIMIGGLVHYTEADLVEWIRSLPRYQNTGDSKPKRSKSKAA